VTAPSSFESTPMTAQDLEWWAEYSKARATTRWEIVDRGNDVPTRPLVSPRMVEILYGGWQMTEPEPEPKARVGP
jgi:hypothetical protein